MTRPTYVLLSALVLAAIVAGVEPVSKALAAASGTSRERISKQAALAGITRGVLLPGYAELTASCAALAKAADELHSSPSVTSLKKTQEAWVTALLAWRRTQSFVRGPVTDLNVYGRLQFWPLRPDSVDRVLRDKRPIDATYVEALGANAVGLFPLEKLLFDPAQDAALLAAFTGPQGERRRTYVRALAHELEKKARVAEDAWKGPAGYGEKFEAGGQTSFNLLINDLLEAVEVGAQGRLHLLVEWNSGNVLRREVVEGGVSASSQQALLSLLLGAEERFNGGSGVGVDDYLRTLSAPTTDRVKVQFQKAIAAVRAIDAPLDQAMTARPLVVGRALDECRTLEILLKVEVASTLGVTLTFKSADGD